MAIVDGYNWTESEVAKLSKEGFVALHMANADVYERHVPEQKERALGLAYDICVPATPTEEEKPKGKGKAKPEPLDAE